jgi:hypothetical protein
VWKTLDWETETKGVRAVEAHITEEHSLYNILCTVNKQHTSRQDAIITIRLYLATYFGRERPSSGQLRTILRYSKKSTEWDPISFSLKLDKI